MSGTEKTSSYWVRLAREMDQERAQERAHETQDRGDRLRAKADDQQAEPTQRRRKGLRP